MNILQTYVISFLTISIYFFKVKFTSILFFSKRKIKEFQKLEIIYNKATFSSDLPRCILEQTMSGESMAQNSRLNFLYQKNKYLTPNLRHLLYNTLVQLHFDYVWSAWYPNLSKILKNNSKFGKQMHSLLKHLIGCPLKEDIISA